MEDRIPVFDNIKFLLIVLMIYGHIRHINCDVPLDVYNIIYSFHMPLFILVSGYFTSKGNEANKFWKTNLNLGFLYILFGSIAACVNVFIYHKRPFSSLFIPPFALWYLLCLIYWRLIINYTSDKVLKSIWFIVMTISISILPSIINLNYFSIARCITFFPFFLLGWLCKEYKWLDNLNNIQRRHKILLVVVALFVCLFVATKVPTGIYWGNVAFDLPITRVLIYKIIAWGIALINSITIYILLPKTKGIKEGQHTLFYYLFHTILLFPCFDIIMRYVPNNVFTSILALIFIMIALYLMRKIPILNKLLYIFRN